jgi:uncharacterized protein YraI
LRGGAIAAALAIALQTFGGMLAGPLATADAVLSATTAVNVRSGPGTTFSILGVLWQGNTITARGASQNGWTPVTYQGKSAWVSSQYLAGTAAPAAAQTSSGGTATTLAALNLRTGAGLSFAVIRVLPKGSTVTLTGRTANGFSEVGANQWVSTSWITTSAAVASRGLVSTPTTQVRATTTLILRSSSSSTYTKLGEIPSGAFLEATGVTANGVAQILYQGELRWVNANYLVPVTAAGPATPAPTGLPAVSATRYAMVALDIRDTSATAYNAITNVPRGTALQITGVVENTAAQIVYGGAVRWVQAVFLSAVPPAASGDYSTGLADLTPKAQAVVADVRVRFTSIKTIYGVRADSIPDHPSGRAVDLMIPNYSSNAAYGQQIADYYRANASKYGISYIIFRQRIWNVARDSEGWRWMADRGGDTANHYDHVHITVF